MCNFHQRFIFILYAWAFFGRVEGITQPEKIQEHAMQRTDGDIIIGGLVLIHSTDGKISEYGIQTVEAINMVIEMINTNDSILPGVNFGTMIIDTKRNDSYTLQQIVMEFFPQFSQATKVTCEYEDSNPTQMPPIFSGVFGSTTSDVSIQSAKLLQAFSIPQISYWTTNPILSDKTVFPYFFRTMPSDKHQVQAILEFARLQGWNYVSIVYEDSQYGASAYTAFEESVGEKGICVAVKHKLPMPPRDQDFENVITTLIAKESPKAVLIFAGKVAKGILKAAAVSKTAAGRYIWIATDAWARRFPEEADKIDSYGTELDGTIGFSPRADPVIKFDEYFTNITLEERRHSGKNPWFSEFISIRNNCSAGLVNKGKRKCSRNEHVMKEKFAQFIYTENVVNAILLFAHSVNEVHKRICNGTPGICSEMNKMRGTNKIARRVYEVMKNISIKGINGRTFKFDNNQDAPSEYHIYNYKMELNVIAGKEKDKWIHIATIDPKGIIWHGNISNKVKESRSVCSEECASNQAKLTTVSAVKCCWKCHPCQDDQFVLNGTACMSCANGSKPTNESNGCEKIKEEYISYKTTHGIVAIVFGIVGVVCTAVVFAAYVKKGESPIVKASGKELCFYVLFGILLTSTNCWAIMTPPSVASCVCSRLILSLGPTIMYSALLTKTIRVVIIFRSKILSPKVKLFLQPSSQLMLTTLIVLVQVFASVLWLVGSPSSPEILYSSKNKPVFRTCVGMVQTTILVGLIFPFALILACTILATANRHVPIGFNETKFVGFTMYTTCVIWLAFIPVFVTNEENYELKLMTVSICLSLSALAVLFCMFGPRCYTMLFHPERNTSKDVMSSSRNTPRQSLAVIDSGQVGSTNSKSANRVSMVVQTTI